MDRASIKGILHEYARSNMPDTTEIDLWPAVRDRVAKADLRPSPGTPASARLLLMSHPRWLPRKGGVLAWSLVLVAGLVVVGSIVGIALLRVAQPEPVSAEEILARAGRAAISGPRTVHMTFRVRSRSDPAGPFSEYQGEQWNQLPDKSLWVSTFRDQNGKEGRYLSGTDGANSYQYNSMTDLPQYYIYTTEQKPYAPPVGLSAAAQQASNVGPLKDLYDATLLPGEEKVAGRSVYVLDLSLKQSVRNQQGTNRGVSVVQYRKRVWIDKETYLELGEQDWDRNDTLVYVIECTSIEVNPSLPPSTFEFRPPAEAVVADMRPASAGEVEQGWRDTAGKTSSTLFRAMQYPEWMVPGRPYYEASQGVVSQAFGDRKGLLSYMVISEGPPSAPNLAPDGWGEGTAVDVDGRKGTLYSKNQAYVLVFDREGTRVMIYMPADATMIRDQIVPIALSMEPVARK